MQMINRVHLLSVSLLCAVVFLVGCGPSRSSTDVNDRYGAFNHVEDELRSLKMTLEPTSSFNGSYNPIEDQLGSSIHYLHVNEDLPEELKPMSQQLKDLELKLHDVYNSPEASKESLMAVVVEMEAIIEKMKETL